MEENGEVRGEKPQETNPKLTRTNRHGRLHRTRSERTRQAQEMIAVFGKQRFETKKISRKRRRMVNGEPSRVEEHVVITPEEEDYVYTQLSSLRESLPMRHRAYVQEQLLGGGANGIAYVESPKINMATEGPVSVVFRGELLGKQDEEDDAHTVLQYYKKLVPEIENGTLPAENSAIAKRLGQLAGSFVFVLFDRQAGRIIAARDLFGKEPLYWGTHMFGEGLLFASERQLIENDCADADQFPAGTFFVSDAGLTNGSLGNIQWLARQAENLEDRLEEEMVCRTSSAPDLAGLARVPSQPDVAAH